MKTNYVKKIYYNSSTLYLKFIVVVDVYLMQPSLTTMENLMSAIIS